MHESLKFVKLAAMSRLESKAKRFEGEQKILYVMQC